MARFKATVTEDIDGNRLLVKSENGGRINLAMATSGDSPQFVSTGNLEEGQEVTVVIKDSPSWIVEAGSEIKTGDEIGVGEGGTAIASDDGFGYAVNDAEEGELVEVIRQGLGGSKGPKGDQGPEGPQGPKGDPGEDAEPQFTSEEVEAIKALINE